MGCAIRFHGQAGQEQTNDDAQNQLLLLGQAVHGGSVAGRQQTATVVKVSPGARGCLRHRVEGATGATATPALRFSYGFHAASAQRRMLRVLADIGFPMPAAFAFLAVGFANSHGKPF